MSTLQISWASCKATFGSTRLQYNQFLKVHTLQIFGEVGREGMGREFQEGAFARAVEYAKMRRT